MKTDNGFRAVNLLYLLVLVLMLANALLAWLPQYVRLALNEILFVFLPAYLFLRLRRQTGQSIAERVRWRWPGTRIALLALALGAGLYPFSAASAGVLMQVLGYTNTITPPDAIPTTVLMGVLAVLSYAVLAPLCEEFLFRGVIQPVYETRGARWGVLFVGLMFIVFHLSLLQGLSIILLSLALGFVNYRTRSLPASILTHFGANGLAALVVTQQVFPTGIQNWITSLPALVGGLVLAGLALFALLRLTRAQPVEPLPAQEPAVPAPRSGGWLARDWPLLLALLIYIPLIGGEVLLARSPDLLGGLQTLEPAAQPGSVPWSAPQRWQYEIRNVAGEPVGEGECRLEPQGSEWELVCDSTTREYEVKQGQSTFASSGGQRVDTLRFTASGGFVSGSTQLNLQDGFGSQIQYSLGDDRILVNYQETGQPEKPLDLPLAQTALAHTPDLALADGGAVPERRGRQWQQWRQRPAL